MPESTGAVADPDVAAPTSSGEPEEMVLEGPSSDGVQSQADMSTTAASDAPPSGRFSVRLTNFEGPFDLLLQLIAKHKLDVTEVALSQVTDDFIAHIRAAGTEWDLGQATEFLVVAATLLDLKTARLLPGAEVEDDEDLALLEARDLLFARLLQYRAYKAAAGELAALMASQSQCYPRSVGLEPQFANVLPEVLLGLTPEQFAALAAKALTPKAPELVDVEHVHGATVSVREQTALLREQLQRTGGASFRALTADCEDTLHVVARFLGLLDLYREGLVSFDQLEAMGELQVRWIGGEGVDALPASTDEYEGRVEPGADTGGADEPDGAEEAPEVSAPEVSAPEVSVGTESHEG